MRFRVNNVEACLTSTFETDIRSLFRFAVDVFVDQSGLMSGNLKLHYQYFSLEKV